MFSKELQQTSAGRWHIPCVGGDPWLCLSESPTETETETETEHLEIEDIISSDINCYHSAVRSSINSDTSNNNNNSSSSSREDSEEVNYSSVSNCGDDDVPVRTSRVFTISRAFEKALATWSKRRNQKESTENGLKTTDTSFPYNFNNIENNGLVNHKNKTITSISAAFAVQDIEDLWDHYHLKAKKGRKKKKTLKKEIFRISDAFDKN